MMISVCVQEELILSICSNRNTKAMITQGTCYEEQHPINGLRITDSVLGSFLSEWADKMVLGSLIKKVKAACIPTNQPFFS